jgi:hypothetical protein
MNYELARVNTQNTRFTSNEDGTITATGVVVYTKIVGAYPDKFLQVDVMSDIIIPAKETSATQPAYIESQVADWVKSTYPNT